MRSFMLLLVPLAHIIAAQKVLNARAGCGASFTKCAPKGAIATNEPVIGPDMSSIYVDIVDSVNNAPKERRWMSGFFAGLLARASSSSLCCEYKHLKGNADADTDLGADGTQCLLLQSYNIPFCYVSKHISLCWSDYAEYLGQLHHELLPS